MTAAKRFSIFNTASENVPPHAWFGISAVFHYLGPAFAVLLFPAVGVLGVAWFRLLQSHGGQLPGLIPKPDFCYSALAPVWR